MSRPPGSCEGRGAGHISTRRTGSGCQPALYVHHMRSYATRKSHLHEMTCDAHRTVAPGSKCKQWAYGHCVVAAVWVLSAGVIKLALVYIMPTCVAPVCALFVGWFWADGCALCLGQGGAKLAMAPARSHLQTQKAGSNACPYQHATRTRATQSACAAKNCKAKSSKHSPSSASVLPARPGMV